LAEEEYQGFMFGVWRAGTTLKVGKEKVFEGQIRWVEREKGSLFQVFSWMETGGTRRNVRAAFTPLRHMQRIRAFFWVSEIARDRMHILRKSGQIGKLS